MVLDNYDSFTYNLVHILKEISGSTVDVYRNDEVDTGDLTGYDKMIISPGPGIPDEAGITKKLLKRFASTKSILGVCLGCQAIAEIFGGSLINLERVYHGVKTDVIITDREDKLFQDVPPVFEAGRYHSWVINDKDLPSRLRVTARDNDNLVMAVSHVDYDVKGVQFHPESVMTGYGKKILRNWLEL